MTLAKLTSAKKKLDAQNVDPDEARYCAVTSSQVDAMLNIATFTSADYNTVRTLVNGKMDSFCGFQFLQTELLAKNSTTRTCLAWAKSGLLLALGADIKTEVTRRADKSYATQVYASMSIGATRMQEKKVCEILCIES
jgi:tryptophan 2,3-dioxygenase